MLNRFSNIEKNITFKILQKQELVKLIRNPFFLSFPNKIL